MWYVYILLCADTSLYTGTTNDLTRRFREHKAGKGAAYTRSHPPIEIIYTESFSTKSEALKREIAIKRWNRKKKIETLQLPVDTLFPSMKR